MEAQRILGGIGVYRKRGTPCVWFAFVVVAFAGCSPNESLVQSPERRFGLDVVAPVQVGGSDWRSRAFQRDHLPRLIVFASEQLNISAIAQNFSRIKLDPAQLVLAERGRVRVYFVSEASGYRNSLGINLEDVGPDSGNPRIIFPDATCTKDLYQSAGIVGRDAMTLDLSEVGERSEDFPLLPGDFVDLGKVGAGTRLNFFLINSEMQVFTVDPDVNEDGVEHMTAFAIEGTPYLMLSFEDLFGGGDRDFSDCVFLVELSHSNIEALIGKIDPWRRIRQLSIFAGTIALVVGAPLLILYLRRRVRIARERRLAERVTALIDGAQPEKALKLIRAQASRLKGGALAWRELEARTLDRMGAIGELTVLEAEHPEAIRDDETLSLKVARAHVETEQWDALHRMREFWRQRETAPADWLALDSDELARQDQNAAARSLLESAAPFQNSGLLSRLAALVFPESPERATELMGRALDMAPDLPELHLHFGNIMEWEGRNAVAYAAYAKALALAPRDPFYRNHLAEHLRRRADIIRALRVWSEGLAPPSMDFLWLKVAFWRKAALPTQLEWPEQLPPGTLMPLVDLVRGLPAGRFWDPARFAPLAEVQPAIEGRQEVFWLRLLEALRVKREDEALRLLNLSRFGKKSWHPDLEIALFHIVTYRRLGFLDPKVGRPESDSPTQHLLFDHLHAWAAGDTEPSPEIERLIRGEEAFAAALLAAGWNEAALQLRRVPLSRSEYPAWYLEELARAERANRGDKAAMEFEAGLGP